MRIFFLICLSFTQIALLEAQELLSEQDVKKQQFGSEIIYKDVAGNLLDGHFKIADSRGNYSDIRFKNGIKHGANTDYDYRDRILKKVTYKNGKAEGMYKTFHQNGKVRRQGKFLKGEEHGTWKVMDEFGNVITIENYANGKKHGKWWKKVYNGQTKSASFITENYRSNEPFGLSRKINEDSIPIWERHYKNALTYTHKEYHDNGKLDEVKHFVDGKVDGENLIYNQNGILVKKTIFVKDQPKQITEYYENGHPKNMHSYANGKRNGLYQVFSDKGVKMAEGHYKDNYKSGIWRWYNESDGSLHTETTYANDTKNGLFRQYNEARQIEVEGNYINGVKDGVWKHYSLAKKLIKEVTYERGNSVSTKSFNR